MTDHAACRVGRYFAVAVLLGVLTLITALAPARAQTPHAPAGTSAAAGTEAPAAEAPSAAATGAEPARSETASPRTPAAPLQLRIAIATTGRTVFDGLIADIAAASRLPTQPIVAYTNALGTLRDFCHGTGGSSPDIILTTIQLRAATISDCEKNGVEHIAQVQLGFGALVLAVRNGSKISKLSARQIYRTLARDVPEHEEFRRNTAVRWSDIDKSLPQLDIHFHVPPRDHGDRKSFNALVLEGGCRSEPLVQAISNVESRTGRCITIRLERVREILPEQAVRALLDAPEGTVGVITHKDLIDAGGKLTAVAVDGVLPDHDSVAGGAYPFSSRYFLAAKRGQAERGRPAALDAAIDRVIARALTDPVIGEQGVVEGLGMIPLTDEEREAQSKAFAYRERSSPLVSFFGWAAGTVGNGISLLGQGLGLGSEAEAEAEGAQDFASLMNLAGYKAMEFVTSVSLIPSVSMTFGIARTMSEADQNHLDRKLVEDARKRVGLIPSMQRSIVRSVLDVSEAAGYEVSKVEIEFLPLPSAKLFMEPADPPISFETSTILRAIERLQERLLQANQ